MNASLRWSAILLAVGVASFADAPEPVQATATAAAHVCMDYPTSRVGADCVARSPQKVGPCGVPGRSEMINVFRPGETIEVRLRETINHPSHYRIAFNPDGDWFPDPETVDDIDPEKEHILIDGIEDAEDPEQTVEVTLPSIECENCTLQLIQVMYDKGGNGFGGRTEAGGNDDMYYSCADIALRGTPVAAAELPSEPARRIPAGLAGLSVVMVLGMAIGAVRRRR